MSASTVHTLQECYNQDINDEEICWSLNLIETYYVPADAIY